MNLYPAMQATMGRWRYFIVKLSMQELADNVKFAADVYDDRTLDQAIQRVLNESRVKKELVTYLIRQKDRFFSSIVVAAIEGDPQWYPVTMEDDPSFKFFRGDRRLNSAFGVLSFDGSQQYYALDGQHRLKAIKELVESDSDVSGDAPPNFRNEEVSVILVVPSNVESEEEFLVRYRRLFGNLNRYAKPTDMVTNIIMDEDDAFAIVTRRLITEHDFFKYSGKQKSSPRIKTKKGKNLKSSDTYFTSLETFYSMNKKLLSTRSRENKGWDDSQANQKEFVKFRPSEEILDAMFDELKIYWDALIEVLPALKSEPGNMRNHSKSSDDPSVQDNVLFWPIGQELLAEVARDLMDFGQTKPEAPTPKTVKDSINRLSKLNWNFHEVPWRFLLLIKPEKTWKIRSEDRKMALILSKRIIKWQLGIEELVEHEIERLRKKWESHLLLPTDVQKRERVIDQLWSEIQNNVIR